MTDCVTEEARPTFYLVFLQVTLLTGAHLPHPPGPAGGGVVAVLGPGLLREPAGLALLLQGTFPLLVGPVVLVGCEGVGSDGDHRDSLIRLRLLLLGPAGEQGGWLLQFSKI